MQSLKHHNPGIYPYQASHLRARRRAMTGTTNAIADEMQQVSQESRTVDACPIVLGVTTQGRSPSAGVRTYLRWKDRQNNWLSSDTLLAHYQAQPAHLRQWIADLHAKACGLNTLYALTQWEWRELTRLAQKLALIPNHQETQTCQTES